MHSYRGSRSHIPSTFSNFINHKSIVSLPTETSSHNSGASTSFSADDGSDKSHAIPNSLIKEQWQLVLDQDATIDELTRAVERCKELVISTDELTTERKWLVRHLVELRFRLREMEDTGNDLTKTESSYKV